jgi:hypothetical protein
VVAGWVRCSVLHGFPKNDVIIAMEGSLWGTWQLFGRAGDLTGSQAASTLYALPDQHSPSGPKGPVHPPQNAQAAEAHPPTKSTPAVPAAGNRPPWQQGVHWYAMGERGAYLPAATRRHQQPRYGTTRASQSRPRTRFARARVARAFGRFFEISCCRFEISIRRPEAHLARRGTIRTTVSLLI